MKDSKEWAESGEEVIVSLNMNEFGITSEELRLEKFHNDYFCMKENNMK